MSDSFHIGSKHFNRLCKVIYYSRIFLKLLTLLKISTMKYPIGVQNFEKIRRDGYLYIDKTELVYKLVSEGSYYFLSRPRRFGKSLLISTLEAYFQGNPHWRLIFRERKSCSAVWLWRGWRRNGRQDRCCIWT